MVRVVRNSGRTYKGRRRSETRCLMKIMQVAYLMKSDLMQ